MCNSADSNIGWSRRITSGRPFEIEGALKLKECFAVSVLRLRISWKRSIIGVILATTNYQLWVLNKLTHLKLITTCTERMTQGLFISSEKVMWSHHFKGHTPHAHTHTHTHIQTHIHTDTLAQTHTHMHTHIHIHRIQVYNMWVCCNPLKREKRKPVNTILTAMTKW